MINKEDAYKIAQDYLKRKNRTYTTLNPIEKIQFEANEKILHGQRRGQIDSTYTVGYGVIWGVNVEKTVFIIISATTGEVLYSLSPHGWIEELEKD
jgi:hypothetical protein